MCMFVCYYCEKTFMKRCALTTHLKTHDEDGKRQLVESSKGSIIKASIAFKNNAQMRHTQQKNIYITNYNVCSFCGCCLLYEYRRNKFCSSRCAATYNNSLRKESGWKRSDESKQKTRNSLILYHDNGGLIATKLKRCKRCGTDYKSNSKNKRLCDACSDYRKSVAQLNKDKKMKPNFCKIEFKQCEVCQRTISHTQSKRPKTCGRECHLKLLSKLSTERLKDPSFRTGRYGRHKKSYMETSFMEWLNKHGVKYEDEKHFYNFEINKHYFTDFYFEQLNLVIELDGNQHNKTKEKDLIRDEFLTRIHGLTVVRITHDEYKKKTRIEEIKKILNLVS